MARRAVTVFLVLSAVSTVAGTLVFSVAALYRFQVAGLSDFQLVLAGTVMEGAVFAFEIPTGVIADVRSRRLSIIIGHIGMGAAFLIEAGAPSVAGVLVAQTLWGIAYTFTSGATIAWLAGEIGDDRDQLTTVLLRSGRVRSLASLVAIPAAFAIATWSLRAVILIGAAVQTALGLWLAVRMPENGFERADRKTRSTWAGLRSTARSGLRVIRASRTLLLIALLLFVAGGSSEAYDRYNQKHIVTDIGVPGAVFGPAFSVTGWLAVVALTSALLGVVMPSIVERSSPMRSPSRLRSWLAASVVLHVVGLIVFAVTRSFLVAFVAVLLIERARSVRGTLTAAWLVPLTPRRDRATVLSTLEQADSVSQMTIGPLIGVVGGAFGTAAAIFVSALVLVPCLPVVLISVRE